MLNFRKQKESIIMSIIIRRIFFLSFRWSDDSNANFSQKAVIRDHTERLIYENKKNTITRPYYFNTKERETERVPDISQEQVKGMNRVKNRVYYVSLLLSLKRKAGEGKCTERVGTGRQGRARQGRVRTGGTKEGKQVDYPDRQTDVLTGRQIDRLTNA